MMHCQRNFKVLTDVSNVYVLFHVSFVFPIIL